MPPTAPAALLSSPIRAQPILPPPANSQTSVLYANLSHSINTLKHSQLPPTTLGGLLTRLGKCQDESSRLQELCSSLCEERQVEKKKREELEFKLGEVQRALRVATSSSSLGRDDGGEGRLERRHWEELERLPERFGRVLEKVESLERELLARLPPKNKDKGKARVIEGRGGVGGREKERNEENRIERDDQTSESRRERSMQPADQNLRGESSTTRESSPELMRDRSVAIEGEGEDQEMEDVKPIIPRAETPAPAALVATQARQAVNPTISTTLATPTKPIIRQNFPPPTSLASSSLTPASASTRQTPTQPISSKQSHPLSQSTSSLVVPPAKKARLEPPIPASSLSLNERISPSSSQAPVKKQTKQQREVISLLDDELDEFVNSGNSSAEKGKKRLPDVELGVKRVDGAGGLIARLQNGTFDEEEEVEVVQSEAEREKKEVEKREQERIKNEQERIKSELAKKRSEELKARLAKEKGKGKVQNPNAVGEAGTPPLPKNKIQSVTSTKLPLSTTTYDSSLPPSATNRQPRYNPRSNLPPKPTHTIFPASDDAEPSSSAPQTIQRPPTHHPASSLTVPSTQLRPSPSTSKAPASKPALSFSLPAQNRPLPSAINLNSSPVSISFNPASAPPRPTLVSNLPPLVQQQKKVVPNGLSQVQFTPAKSKVGSMGFTPEAQKSTSTNGGGSMVNKTLMNGANLGGKNGGKTNANSSTAPPPSATTVPTGPSSWINASQNVVHQQNTSKAKQLAVQPVPLHPRNAKPSPAPIPPSIQPAAPKSSLYANVQINSLTPQQDKFKAQKANNPPPPQLTLPIPTEPVTFPLPTHARNSTTTPSSSSLPNRPNSQTNQPVPSKSSTSLPSQNPPPLSSQQSNLPLKPSLQTQTRAQAESQTSTSTSTQSKPVPVPPVPIVRPTPIPSTSAVHRPRSPSPQSPEEVRRQLGLPIRGRSRSRSRSFSPMNMSRSSSPPSRPFRSHPSIPLNRSRPPSPRRSRSPLPPRRSPSPRFRRSYSPRRRSRSISRSPLSSSPPPRRRSRTPDFDSPEVIRRRAIGRSRSRSPPLRRSLPHDDRFARRYSPEPRYANGGLGRRDVERYRIDERR